MRPSRRWLSLLAALALAGPATAQDAPATALSWWQKGQDASLQGRADEAIACYLRSLQLDRTFSRSYLGLAAAYLQQGQDARAEPWLARYVEVQPDHLVARVHHAELLLRLDQPAAARASYETLVAEAQERPEHARFLIEGHSRLMEIAAQLGDPYAEHLHRGIGLFWLARQRLQLDSPTDSLSAESLFCRAAEELLLARGADQARARPCWYLHLVWRGLGQHQPARRCLRHASSLSPADLTAAERRDLQLASWQQHTERSRK